MSNRPAHIDPEYLELVFTVAREYSGWRADRYISYRIPRLSRTRVQRILKEFAFDESGRKVKPNRLLKEGERITIYKKTPDEPDVPRHFEVLYEDDNLTAINKPPGLPVHPTARYLNNTLTALLKERYGEQRPVLTHRLDSETSGIVLCAKGVDSERKIKRMFADRKVKKTYLAIVDGIPDQERGRIEVPMGFDPHSEISVKMACNVPDGLPALTEYQVLRRVGDRSLLEVRPRTGRQHQIRVHLAHVGLPIIGDKMYGPDEALFLEYIETGMTPELERRAGHRRQALHAHRLELAHPATKEQLVVECPLPEDLSGLLE